MSLNRVITSVFPELRQAIAMMEQPLAVAARHHRGAFTPLTYTPAIDLSETNSGYVLEAELPGVSKDNISIEFDNGNTLVLKSRLEHEVQEASPETKSEGEQSIVQSEEKKYWTKERMLASFERRVKFPGRVDPEGIKANYKDGVLTVDIPKLSTDRTQVKKIPIDN